MGRRMSIPTARLAAGFALPSVVGARAATPSWSEGTGEPICIRVVAAPGRRHFLRCGFTVPTSRRRDLGGMGSRRAHSDLVLSCLPWPAVPLGYAVTAGSLPQRNSVPSTQSLCSTAPSLRASATLARRAPRRFATSTAQRFSDENRVPRVSSTFAAS